MASGLPTQGQAATGLSEVTSLSSIERLWGLAGPVPSDRIASKAFYWPKSVTAQPGIQIGENWTSFLMQRKGKNPFPAIMKELRDGPEVHT